MKINSTIQFIFKTYLLVLSIFTVFRTILFFSAMDQASLEDVALGTILQAFVMGIRFDIVISGYILFFPTFFLLIFEMFKVKSKIVSTVFFSWFFLFFSIAFIICAADIPYFNQFYDRFTVGAFEWIDNFDFVVSMIMEEPKYFLILLPLIGLEVLFFIGLRKMFRNRKDPVQMNLIVNILVSVLFLGVLFLGCTR